MKIGILQAGHLPEPIQESIGGDYYLLYTQMLAPFGIETECWDVVDGVFPESIDAAEGWLITGSKFGVYDDQDWIAPLEEFVRQAHAAEKPMVGICFGHQLIAQALGGKVEKYSGGWNVGNTEYDWDGTPLSLNAWHQDQVIEPPEGANVLGKGANCDIAFLDYGSGAMSVQPHPEFSSHEIGMLIDARKGVVPDDRLAMARDGLTAANDNRIAAARIAGFLKEARDG